MSDLSVGQGLEPKTDGKSELFASTEQALGNDVDGLDCIVTFTCMFSKMVHCIATSSNITAEALTRIYLSAEACVYATWADDSDCECS